MAVLLRLLFFVLLFAFFRSLLKRFLGGASGAPGQPAPRPAKGSVPPIQSGRTVRDPLCGTFVAEELSLRARVDNATLHFCSESCRDSYLAALRQPQGSHAR